MAATEDLSEKSKPSGPTPGDSATPPSPLVNGEAARVDEVISSEQQPSNLIGPPCPGYIYKHGKPIPLQIQHHSPSLRRSSSSETEGGKWLTVHGSVTHTIRDTVKVQYESTLSSLTDAMTSHDAVKMPWVNGLTRWTSVEVSTFDGEWVPLTEESLEAAKPGLMEKEGKRKLRVRVLDVCEGWKEEEIRQREKRAQCGVM